MQEDFLFAKWSHFFSRMARACDHVAATLSELIVPYEQSADEVAK